MSKKNISGIVLAGGKSSRMGTDKGLLELNGKTFIEHVLSALIPVVDTVFIIANNGSYHKFGYPVYEDIIKDCGPMGGIYTGLVKSTTSKNIIVSCDIPFITTKTLSDIILGAGNAEIAVPEHGGKLEPLCAIYTKGCIERFGQLLEKKEWKMQEALKYFNTTKVQFPEKKEFEKNFININTPQEFINQINR